MNKRNIYRSRDHKPSPRDIRRAIKIARREPDIMGRAVVVGRIASRWTVLSEWTPDGQLHVLYRVYLAPLPLGTGDAYAYRPVDMADPVTYTTHGTVRLAYVCSSATGNMPALTLVRR